MFSSLRLCACAPLLLARVVRWVAVQNCMDLLRRRGEPLVGTPKKTAIQCFWIHIDYSSKGCPESVVIAVLGRKLEVVKVDCPQRACFLVPKHSLPFFCKS